MSWSDGAAQFIISWSLFVRVHKGPTHLLALAAIFPWVDSEFLEFFISWHPSLTMEPRNRTTTLELSRIDPGASLYLFSRLQ